MRAKNVALQVLLAAATLAGAANAEETARCVLRLQDDRGADVQENVTVCRDAAEETCFDIAPGDAFPEVDVTTLRIEGEGHGPVTVKPETADDGTCTIVVPRKADVTIAFDGEKTRSLEASFYRPDDDPDLFRPARRVTVEEKTTVRVPAGPYVLSMNERGWAPDLRLFDAAPGSSHSFRFQQQDGWSVVLRTVADVGGTSVADAEVEVRTLPGFDEPHRGLPDDPKPRTLLKRKSNARGLVVVSGLRVPVATAAVEHEKFLDTDFPAISSDAGTFRVFETRLHEGGSIAVRVVREGVAAVHARCELAPPEIRRVKPWGLRETLYEARADDLGICRASNIPAAVYALKVSLPDSPDAFAIEPIVVHDGEVSDPTVEMRPIVVSGRVFRGEQGAPGYKVKFERTGPFEVDAPYYPAGDSTTDDEGNYEITLWVPGQYLGQVLNDSTTAGNFRRARLDADETIDFRLAAAELDGQVVTDSGEPWPDARVTIRTPNLYRSVLLDEDARFRILFRDESGKVEIRAMADGFEQSEPMEFMLDKDGTPDPVTLVISRRTSRPGRVVLPSGQPATGIHVSVHRLDPNQYAYPVERLVTDTEGYIDIPFEPQTVRLFFGGPGCALASFDLPPTSEADAGAPFEIRCERPSHLIVRLNTDDVDLRGGAPILLRQGNVVVPPSVLERHLMSLGLPTTTDGQGRIALVALAPGNYDLYHGNRTSYRNLLDNYEAAKLNSVTLGMNATVETEITLGFRREKPSFSLDF